MSEEVKFLINLVKEASLLIDDEFVIESKGDEGDLVTNFDFKVEKYIIDKIKENYPDYSIVSEEYNSEKQLTDNCFTVDPIDGTINFANNIPLWGIQIACIKNKKIQSAVIYLPKINELYYADENGAYMNGNPISVNTLGIDKGLYCVEGPNRVPGQVKIRKINPNCRDFFCATLNFAWVACGRLSATIFKKDSLWDYIPGQFIVEKAGGVVYNDKGTHIATNNDEFLQLVKENASFDENEKVIVTE